MRALKNATANETTTQSTAERKKGGGLGGEKTLLRQRVKEMNDTTAIDCSIVMHAPRGGILIQSHEPSAHARMLSRKPSHNKILKY